MSKDTPEWTAAREHLRNEIRLLATQTRAVVPRFDAPMTAFDDSVRWELLRLEGIAKMEYNGWESRLRTQEIMLLKFDRTDTWSTLERRLMYQPPLVSIADIPALRAYYYEISFDTPAVKEQYTNLLREYIETRHKLNNPQKKV